MVRGTGAQDQDGNGHRPGHRGRPGRHHAVEQQHGTRHDRCRPPADHQHAAGANDQRGEDGDVPAGNRHDVIGPRLLQPPLVLFGEAGAIANQHRRGQPARLRVERADVAGNRRPRPGADRRRAFGDTRSPPGHFHQCRALHAPDQDDAAAGQRAAFVRHTRIQIGGRKAEGCRSTDAAAGPPAAGVGRQQRAANGQADAADCVPAPWRLRFRAAGLPHLQDIDDQRRAEGRDGGVVPQDALDRHRLTRRPGREPAQEWRIVGAGRRVHTEGQAGAQGAGADRRRRFPAVVQCRRADPRCQGQQRAARRGPRCLRTEMVEQRDGRDRAGKERDGHERGGGKHTAGCSKGRAADRRGGAAGRAAVRSGERGRKADGVSPSAWQFLRGIPGARAPRALRNGSP